MNIEEKSEPPCIEIAYVQGGIFKKGIDTRDSSEKPVHTGIVQGTQNTVGATKSL